MEQNKRIFLKVWITNINNNKVVEDYKHLRPRRVKIFKLYKTNRRHQIEIKIKINIELVYLIRIMDFVEKMVVAGKSDHR
ncbi:hypothetical protein BpHYR1_041128 [Brachionus plicatilis]|uniref:Uncharacterized protein n=1 Tax=Brachionus plicatilis TaxID=10195 RepID=A0A3M7S421_BRAPC|nr:hypothetical protein BpHYR1_041128 [Brachionus plicatilis]